MTKLLVGLLLAGLPHWLSNTVARATDDDDRVHQEVRVFVAGACGEADGELNWVSADEGEGSVQVVVVRDCVGEVEDGRSEKAGRRVVRRIVTSGSDKDPRGWLGVAIGPVPDEVKAQLEIDGIGVIIENISKESPADLAGLEVHDIILSIDGENLDGGFAQLVKIIRVHEPNDVIEVAVLREGQEQVFSVELGTRDNTRVFAWKMAGLPFGEIEEEIHIRGKMLHLGSGGKWVFKDFGDLDELSDLPEKIRMFIPRSGRTSTQVFMDDGHKKIKCRVERDGTALVIEQEDDGEITVRRTDENGEESAAVYENKDALQAADEEAYDAFRGAGKAMVLHLNMDGIKALAEIELPDLDVELDLGEWKEHLGAWGEQLELKLSEVGDNFEQAMEQVENVLEQWKAGDHAELMARLHGLPHLLSDDDKHPLIVPMLLQLGKPRHQFELLIDGSIEARIRKGDSELLRVFQDEADLEQRNPKLYNKYMDLLAAEEE